MLLCVELVAHGPAMVLEEREAAAASCCLAGADSTDQQFLGGSGESSCPVSIFRPASLRAEFLPN